MHALVISEVDVVDQIAADIRRVVLHGNAMFSQMRGRPDARAHQQLRRVERACREDHLGARLDALAAARAHDVDAGRAHAVEAHAQHGGIGDQMQIRARLPIEIRARHRAALAAALRDLIEADAFLTRAVEVVVGGETRFERGLHEALRDRVALAQIGHAERAARAVPRIRAARVVLGAQEVRQHVVPRPARAAEPRPFVVVERMAARVDHRVDGAGAAEAAAARLVAASSVQARLRHRLIGVVVFVAKRHERRHAHRHVDEEIALGVRTGFDQCDARVGTAFGEASRQRCAARTATYDHVVVLHVSSCWPGPALARVPSAHAADAASQSRGCRADVALSRVAAGRRLRHPSCTLVRFHVCGRL